MVIRAVTWNLFHGRAEVVNRALRSRVRRRTSLMQAFGSVLAHVPWDVALLQEAPPRWLEPLCRDLGAHGALALTARNVAAPVQRRLAGRNPDLLGAWEGGSNQLLVRPPWMVVETRRLRLARRPERRRMLWARLRGPDGGELAVACVHMSKREGAAAEEAVRAAEHAAAWAAGAPLLLGGDFNLRPDRSGGVFAELERRFGLRAPTGPRHIDHLLGVALVPEEGPRALEAAVREVPGPDGRPLRLSDHPLVAASWRRAGS
jgi:endonuclease/exonuclease/phosphatase family metal-dependent hydrolase